MGFRQRGADLNVSPSPPYLHISYSFSFRHGACDANYSFDGNARLTKLTDWIDGTDGLRYGYDDAGRLTSITDYDDSVLTYAYDDAGNVTSMNDYL